METDGMKRIITLIDGSPVGHANVHAACRLAAERSAVILAVHPIEVPNILPLDYPMKGTVAALSSECERAELVAKEFGVSLQATICQAYSVVDAVVGVAEREEAEAICLAAPQGLLGWLRWLQGPGPEIVRLSPCPVLLIGTSWRAQAREGIAEILTRSGGRSGAVGVTGPQSSDIAHYLGLGDEGLARDR